MGQVPKREISPVFLIVGSGRLAKHLKHYLSSLELNVLCWSRAARPEFNSLSPGEFLSAEERLRQLAQKASHILLAISDSALDHFVQKLASLPNKTLVHFSGALTIQGAWSAHPLMAFTEKLYPLEFYLEIPFVIEQQGPHFEELLPLVPNRNYAIPSDKKPLYHALCVVGGNLTTLLWQETLKGFESDLHLPVEILQPYMKRLIENLIVDPRSALTGPLVRKDFQTIEKNLKALEKTQLRPIYQAFVSQYCKPKESSHECTAI